MIMQKRRIPVLDSLFDRINMLLWPRLKLILDANMKSIETANPKKLGAVSKNPHYVTRRYAEFSASIFTLHGGMESLGIAGGGEDMLLNDLAAIRSGVLELMKRLANEVSNSKQRLVFLINNYDQVLTVFSERNVVGDETARFEELLSHHRSLYVEEELMDSFSTLISFVQRAEPQVQQGASEADLDANAVLSIARDFASTWKAGIEAIYQNTLEYFANFRNGMEILKQVLTQLLLYYTRFQDIIKKSALGRRQPGILKELVSTATILVEIKKYSRQI